MPPEAWSWTDIRHLLLSHIHLDHAGAAGAIVREHPHVQVHVSEIGAPHLVDPSRLETSARRLFGDAFDDLWGELVPVPPENVHVVGDRVLGLDCFPSPGHAWHHVSYLDREGTLYTGDSVGVRIAPARFVLPPTPPPEIDLEAWEDTIVETERRAPARLAVVHFGVFDDVQEHLAAFRETLQGGRAASPTGWMNRPSSPPPGPTSPPPTRTRSRRTTARPPTPTATSGSSATGASGRKPLREPTPLGAQPLCAMWASRLRSQSCDAGFEDVTIEHVEADRLNESSIARKA